MITTLVYRDSRFSAQNPPLDSLAPLRATAGVVLWVDLDQPTPAEATAVLETLFGRASWQKKFEDRFDGCLRRYGGATMVTAAIRWLDDGHRQGARGRSGRRGRL